MKQNLKGHECNRLITWILLQIAGTISYFLCIRRRLSNAKCYILLLKVLSEVVNSPKRAWLEKTLTYVKDTEEDKVESKEL